MTWNSTLALLAAVAIPAHGGELALESLNATQHYEGGSRFNQRHGGLGIALRLDDGSGMSIGRYQNSQDRESNYLSLYAHGPAGPCAYRWGAVVADGYPDIPDFGNADTVAVPYAGFRCGPLELLVFSFAVAISIDVPLADW